MLLLNIFFKELMKQLSKTISIFLFTLLTAVLIVVAFISYQNFNEFNKSVDEVMHTNEVRSKIVEVLVNLKDANSGQRGYLLTNDSVFLKPYNLALQSRYLTFASLDTFMNDNIEQQENLKKLKTLVDQRYLLLNKSLELSKNDLSNSVINSAILNGENKMIEVEELIKTMLNAEDKLLQKRTAFKNSSASNTPIFLLVLSLFSILIITLFFFRLQKETSERISITESNLLLQNTKQQIEASEKRFRMLTQSIPHMVWTATADGNKNFFNQYFLDYTGLSYEKLKDDGILKIIYPDDLEKDLRLWQNSLRTGEDFIIEKRIRHRDGTYKWHLSRAIAQKDIDGNITEWIGSSTEIEDQKKISTALAKGEEQFRTFANNIQNLAWIANDQGYIYWYNQRWYDFTGTTLEEMQGIGSRKVHHPDYFDKIEKFVNQAWKKDQPFEATFPLRRHDGEYHWFLTRVYPVKNSDGNIERWIGTNTDITEQRGFTEELEIKVKERTEKLYLQNQTFEFAESIASFGSYKWNIKNGTLQYSDNLFRLLDCEPQEFVPTFEKFLTFIHPDDLQQVIYNGEQTKLKSELVETPYRIISKTGKVKYIRSSGKFLGEGDNSLLIGTMQDISKDVLATNDLKTKNLELENANTELASFSYIASHDLQEPLRKIQGFSNRILDIEGDKLSDTTKHYYKRIIASAQRMQNLIDSLLSFSHYNLSETIFKKIDLNKSLKESLTVLNELISKKNAVIESQTLPTINAVPIQMHQLFLNLISNSLKYSKPDVAPHIKITTEKVISNEISGQAKQNLDFWKITISDNGIGFDQQYENKIFELFQQLHNKSEYDGTGIGLAICKKIVQTHNGTITGIAQLGIGAIFTIFLPENNKL